MKAAGFSPRFSPERQDPPNEQSKVRPASVGPEKLTSLRDRSFLITLVGGLFFFSGFAALVYQVVWMRHLSLFFGSDVYAVAITLSVFMGGLSLGSWLAEKFVDRLERPLVLYGGIEIGRNLAPKSRSSVFICRALSSCMESGAWWKESRDTSRISGLKSHAALYAAVESASEEELPSSCARISRSVPINSSRETWLFLN